MRKSYFTKNKIYSKMYSGGFMSRILIFFIRIYQAIPFSSHQNCRFIPTCSNYMIEAIQTHGAMKGVQLGVQRLLKCRPHGKYGYDPVPKKEEKV